MYVYNLYYAEQYFVRFIEYLDQLCDTKKKVYVGYSHFTVAEWSFILACTACDDTNAVDEAKGINAFIKDHPGITGIFLRKLDQVVRFDLFIYLIQLYTT